MPAIPMAARLCAAVLGVALVVGLVCYFLTGPRRAREAAAKADAAAVTAEASKEAARDALKITVDTQALHGRIDVVTQGNADAIRNAPGASALVDPALHDTGLGALCLRSVYRDEPSCKRLLDAGSGQHEGADAGGSAPR